MYHPVMYRVVCSSVAYEADQSGRPRDLVDLRREARNCMN
jgi:hypothetical protein